MTDFRDILSMPVQQMVFDKLRIQVQEQFGQEMLGALSNADLEIITCERQRQLIMRLRTFILSKMKRSIDVEKKWPADWWQAFKERWFPKWAKNRWPVKYESVSVHEQVVFVCPHVNVKLPEGNHVHFQWMCGDEP